MKNLSKIRKKRGKKEEKSGRKGNNREGSFPLPLLTDKAGYTENGGRITDFSCHFDFGENLKKKKKKEEEKTLSQRNFSMKCVSN